MSRRRTVVLGLGILAAGIVLGAGLAVWTSGGGLSDDNAGTGPTTADGQGNVTEGTVPNEELGVANDPVAVYEGTERALDNDDPETFNALLHENSSIDPIHNRTLRYMSSHDLLEKTILERTDGRALVRVRMDINYDLTDARPQFGTKTFELRTQNGEWKLYDQPGYRYVELSRGSEG